MASQNRPLSPHLQVYRPQLTSIMSILHRLTGVALAFGTILLVYWLAAAAGGAETFETAQDLVGSFIGRLLLFGWTWHFPVHSERASAADRRCGRASDPIDRGSSPLSP